MRRFIFEFKNSYRRYINSKGSIVSELGADNCICYRNGFNDIEMFKKEGLAVAVLGQEGMYSKLITYADIVVRDISLLLNINRMVADL